MTDAPTAPAAPAQKKANSSGCLMLLIVVVALLAVGVIWKAVAPGDSHTKAVSRSDYGTAWPLTVDSAKLGCAGGRDPYVQVGSIRYALTDGEAGYTAIDSIWADDPGTPGLKLSIGGLRADALKLC